MPDATPFPEPSVERRLPKRRRGVWGRIVLLVCLAGVLGYVGVAARQVMRDKETARQSQDQTVASAGLGSPTIKTLAATFTDKEGRLLADPPASADQWVNPETLVVAHIDGPDETPGNSWAEWEARLAASTGKKVVDRLYTNSAADVASTGAGKVTLLALHGADAPFLVNNYGFQPFAVLGDESGTNGNRLDLIVPAGSPIAAPGDLRGHRLVCTVPSSITGYRAAVAYLLHDQGLRPNVDYEVIWSMKQKTSITGIAEKTYEAAAVSDEKLQSLVAKGTIQASQYKIIYQSPVIPRTTIGYFYNLNPALAEQIRKTLLAPGPAATGPTTEPTTAPGSLGFRPVDYKRDFEFVREIDNQFDPRFDAQARKTGQAE